MDTFSKAQRAMERQQMPNTRLKDGEKKQVNQEYCKGKKKTGQVPMALHGSQHKNKWNEHMHTLETLACDREVWKRQGEACVL